jgi:hypothetical protein
MTRPYGSGFVLELLSFHDEIGGNAESDQLENDDHAENGFTRNAHAGKVTWIGGI